MDIYSTLTRSKENFETINKNRVNLFVCGPTVYDDAHIGHGRTYISFDTIKRYLEYSGYAVFYIQNITDIDDKIINRSKESGIPANDIARKFEKRYIEDMTKLNVTGVNLFARATDHLDEIIDQIQRLIDKGFAYESEDGVYFEIEKFKEFGKLSNRKIEELSKISLYGKNGMALMNRYFPLHGVMEDLVGILKILQLLNITLVNSMMFMEEVLT